MKLKTLVVLSALVASATAFAAKTAAIPEGVTVSTDPAKAAEVERHAQELQAKQQVQQQPSVNSSGTGSKKAAARHKRAHKQSAPKKSAQ